MITIRPGFLDRLKGLFVMKITVDIGEIELDALAMKKVTKLVNDLKGEIMASNEKFQIALEKLDENTNKLADVVQSVVVADEAEDAAFRAEIASLKEQIANNEAVTQEQLDGLAEMLEPRSEKLNDVVVALQAIGSNPTTPLPDVTVEPEPTPEPAPAE